jgi:3-methyladenine DNA glycosylase AlkD
MRSTVITNIRKELEQNSDEHTQRSSHRFFKEPVQCYGVKTALVSGIAKRSFKEIAAEDKKGIFSLCEELFRSDYCEEAFIAAEWAYRLRDQYTPDDFARFDRWIERYINNWAKCDTLCNHAVGSFVDRYPEYVKHLKT